MAICTLKYVFWMSGHVFWMSGHAFWVSGLVFWVSGLVFYSLQAEPLNRWTGLKLTLWTSKRFEAAHLLCWGRFYRSKKVEEGGQTCCGCSGCRTGAWAGCLIAIWQILWFTGCSLKNQHFVTYRLQLVFSCNFLLCLWELMYVNDPGPSPNPQNISETHDLSYLLRWGRFCKRAIFITWATNSR